jgi:hypothetical protein
MDHSCAFQWFGLQDAGFFRKDKPVGFNNHSDGAGNAFAFDVNHLL